MDCAWPSRGPPTSATIIVTSAIGARRRGGLMPGAYRSRWSTRLLLIPDDVDPRMEAQDPSWADRRRAARVIDRRDHRVDRVAADLQAVVFRHREHLLQQVRDRHDVDPGRERDGGA